eukprot:600259-Amorphochlora_amoeboformis.AAC.2
MYGANDLETQLVRTQKQEKSSTLVKCLMASAVVLSCAVAYVAVSNSQSGKSNPNRRDVREVPG